ncbi:MAG: hypothetical protein BGO98_31340 [Myxococcales bacterium 68-20]|nr:MAG: hypothetical protein BGO98_31340 [Myxococcales bacterium 68-20]
MAREQKTSSEEKAQETTTSVQVAQPEEQGKTALERAPRGGLATSEWASPFATMRRLMNDMDRFLSGVGFGPSSSLFAPITPFEMARDVWMPAIETFERGGKLVLRTDLPGLRREDVNVEIVGNELVVSGERKQEAERTVGGRLYSERRYGTFERRLTLPEGINPERIEASFDNGVLEISLAIPGRESRKIEIKSGVAKTGEGSQGGDVH